MDSGDNSDDGIWTDDGYSTNNSNNPCQFDHLHKSQSSVEESESAEDLENNAVTDANIVKEKQNIPKLPGGEGTNKNLRFYHIVLSNMESEAPALPEAEGVPALPEFPQQAPEENSTQQEAVALETDIWIIEATDDLDEAGICHKNFYGLLKEWFQGRDYTCTLLTKQKYYEILQFCLDLMNGAHHWSLLIAGNKQAYKWAAKYDAIVVREESAVLVLRPTKGQNVDAQSTCLSAFQSTRLSALQQPTYVEKLFLDPHKIHHVDHCKGNTFYKRAKQAHKNVPREPCKMFTDCHPQCIRKNH